MADFYIVDEDDFYEVEMEEADRTCKICFGPLERINYIREFRDQFNFHNFAHVIGCVRGEYFSGHTSALLELTG